MAPRTLFAVTASLAIVAAVFFREASAQTSGCTASILSLASCLGYITGVDPTPSSSCCGGLASVVKTSPLCLCQVLNGGASQFGVTVNQTQALQLPGACNVETPPASNCNGETPLNPRLKFRLTSPQTCPENPAGPSLVPTHLLTVLSNDRLRCCSCLSTDYYDSPLN
ncbi:unnamed protein product [Spirodela intermedia]|uniref:Bifunctional inhibitor/plant lipid transfer protein/seed storage helical domain-containing protein n=1 Tax=Spirodela intermedia TaxID=51605 RepID=A0A7I8KMX1_SPIIN|nr:unnamed protein product [Spirodela intermedia]